MYLHWDRQLPQQQLIAIRVYDCRDCLKWNEWNTMAITLLKNSPSVVRAWFRSYIGIRWTHPDSQLRHLICLRKLKVSVNNGAVTRKLEGWPKGPEIKERCSLGCYIGVNVSENLDIYLIGVYCLKLAMKVHGQINSLRTGQLPRCAILYDRLAMIYIHSVLFVSYRTTADLCNNCVYFQRSATTPIPLVIKRLKLSRNVNSSQKDDESKQHLVPFCKTKTSASKLSGRTYSNRDWNSKNQHTTHWWRQTNIGIHKRTPPGRKDLQADSCSFPADSWSSWLLSLNLPITSFCKTFHFALDTAQAPCKVLRNRIVEKLLPVKRKTFMTIQRRWRTETRRFQG